MRKARRVARPRVLSVFQRIELLEDRSLLSGVPAFSSLPGADHTIFLDFDGHTVTGMGWNNYYEQDPLEAPAYDLDGDTDSYNNTELSRIEESWERMAEDFRPFKVNVTTVDPGTDALRKAGAGDTQWGVRVIITQEADMLEGDNSCGCGGIAYINSFNSNADLPVWVYTNGGKSIAEAGSHEVGHALGLSHDGLIGGASYYRGHDGPSAETGWASIMGVGYYENVSQWDKGEYFNSNNGGSTANYSNGSYGRGPDDLAIISNVGRNGFGYRADDAGNTDAAAEDLGVTGTIVEQDGVIEKTQDVDVFRFETGAGDITLDIDPFSVGDNNNGANLDVKATLYDGEGTLVAESNPEGKLDALIEETVAAGEYFLHIDGVGVGNPTVDPPTGYSDYASLGQYSITGTIVEPDDDPTLNIDDVVVDEDAGTATLTVTLDGVVVDPVTVDFATVDGTAEAPGDYTANNGSLSFLTPGTQTVTVSIIDDAEAESLETFTVELTNASNAVVEDGVGEVSITDDDIGIEISNTAADEGNGTTRRYRRRSRRQAKDFFIEVNLTSPSTERITVDFQTQDGTAYARRRDYVAGSGTVTFEPGETSKAIKVVVWGDNQKELNETFKVLLSNATNAVIADNEAEVTILNDDGRSGGGGGNGIIADPFWFFEGPDSHHHNSDDMNAYFHGDHHLHEHDLHGHSHDHFGHDHSHDHDHNHGGEGADHNGDDPACTCCQCTGLADEAMAAVTSRENEDLFAAAALPTGTSIASKGATASAATEFAVQDEASRTRSSPTFAAQPTPTSADSLFSDGIDIEFDTL